MGEMREPDGPVEDGGGSVPLRWLVSRREACELLKEQAGLDRETARRVLAGGLAGEGLRLRGAVLHERSRVEELAARPFVSDVLDQQLDHELVSGEQIVADVCLRGTFVARLGPRRPPSRAAGPWRLSALARIRMFAGLEARGFVPLVATLGGFVVSGGEIVGLRGGPEGTTFEVREPGEWFATLWQGSRLPGTPGPPWQMWPLGLWELASGA